MHRSSASIVRPAIRAGALRRSPAPRSLVRRTYATAVDQQTASSAGSHVAAGAAGGALVFLAAYGYYHFSGAKTAVNTVRQASQTAKDLKDKAVNATPSPKAMLGFVRSAALSYSSAFPGASHLVNSAFDQIDEVAERRGPEVEKIVKQVYNDINQAVRQGGDKVTDKVMAAIQEAMSQVQKLSSEVSENVLQPYLDRSPQLKSAINESLEQLNSFGDKYGPEAKKIANDTVNRIKEISDKGINGETIAAAVALTKSKVQEIQALGAKAGSEAYSRAAEGARPFLEKAPDVKKYFESSIDSMKEYVGDDGIKIINDTYADLEHAGKKGDTKALMNIVRERVGQLQKLAKDKGGDLANKAADKASQLPGADKLFDAVPSLKDISQLRQLAEEKGGDFEKLLNQTYDEIKEILEKRSQEAKQLGGEAVSEAKSKAGSK